MKVVLTGIKGEFDNQLGEGIRRYCYELYKGLKNIDGLHVDKSESSSVLGDIPSFVLEHSFKNYRQYDILHNLGPRLMKPISANTIITTAHDFRPLLDKVWVEELPKTAMGKVYKSLVVAGFRQALKSDFLICDSTQTRDDAIHLGYSPKNTFVALLGIDDRFRTSIPKRNDKTFKVGYIGSMSKHKNIQMSIKAFKLTEDCHMEFEVWGKQNMEYGRLIRLARGDKRIKFMGFTPESELVRTYDRFDVFVHSILDTGFELEILEAEARGIPVIIYKGGRVPREVRKYCFEAEDEVHMAQIIQELKDNGYSESRRSKTMKYARSFTWDKMCKDTFKVYDKVFT